MSCFFVRDQSYLVTPFKEYLLCTYCALANAEISRAQSLDLNNACSELDSRGRVYSTEREV